MIRIDNILLKEITAKAKASQRKRMNYNFHTYAGDTLQRMLNCLELGTYCRPHKHENPPKREVFIILKGTVAVLQFNNEGKIIDYTILNNTNGQYGVEIPPLTWHSIIALENESVVFECKDGPYEPTSDKDFAPWAPVEGSTDVDLYLEKMMERFILK